MTSPPFKYMAVLGIDEILRRVKKEKLISKEDYWCKKLNVNDPKIGYNLAITHDSIGFYKHSDETKKRLIEIHKNIARKGKDSNFYGKCYHGRGSWYITTSGDKVWMRSSWEFKYSKYLDSEKIKWEYDIPYGMIFFNIFN